MKRLLGILVVALCLLPGVVAANPFGQGGAHRAVCMAGQPCQPPCSDPYYCPPTEGHVAVYYIR